MGASNPIELATEIVAAFISNNPLPKGELPSLIRRAHRRREIAAGPESAQPQIEEQTPAMPIRKSITPDFLICLDDGKRSNHYGATWRARPDAGAIPREMKSAIRLSHGCAELRGATIRVSKTVRTSSDSAEGRCPQERWPVEGG